MTLLYDQLRCYFARVTCAKPRSSRMSSMGQSSCLSIRTPREERWGADAITVFFLLAEAFVVCEGFRTGFSANGAGQSMVNVAAGSGALAESYRTQEEIEAEAKLISPFIACGDLR